MTSIIPLLPNSLLASIKSPLFLAQNATDYATPPGAPGAVLGSTACIIGLLVGLVMIIAMWKVFTKAGQPGWACLIPFYNIYVLCKIVGRPGWWLLLMLIPFVNFIVGIILCLDLAKSFGKGVGFGIGLIFLGFIFMCILAFGSAQYQGPAKVTA
jgi:uncharacterized membrane protein YhaH (DUF805 family)